MNVFVRKFGSLDAYLNSQILHFVEEITVKYTEIKSPIFFH